MGPMTGRRAGYCSGDETLEYADSVPGSGYGRGRGWHASRGYRQVGGGRGWRHRFYATGRPGWANYGYGPPGWAPAPAPTSEQELGMLRREADWFKDQLDAISQRIAEIEGE
jgi:hypothetical protein